MLLSHIYNVAELEEGRVRPILNGRTQTPSTDVNLLDLLSSWLFELSNIVSQLNLHWTRNNVSKEVRHMEPR